MTPTTNRPTPALLSPFLRRATIALGLAVAVPVTAYSQEEKSAPEPEPAPNQGMATVPAASTYANIVFGRALQQRCQLLEGAPAQVFAENADAIIAYMRTVFVEGLAAQIENDASAEAEDAERHPCGDQAKDYLERLQTYAGEVAETIRRIDADQAKPQ